MAGGPNENYAKVGHRGVGVTWPTSEFLDLLVSQKQLKLESLVHAVCVVHSVQPSPNYFGLLLIFKYMFKKLQVSGPIMKESYDTS